VRRTNQKAKLKINFQKQKAADQTSAAFLIVTSD